MQRGKHLVQSNNSNELLDCTLNSLLSAGTSPRFPSPLKNRWESLCGDISQIFEDSWMNPIGPIDLQRTSWDSRSHTFSGSAVSWSFFQSWPSISVTESLLVHHPCWGQRQKMCLTPVPFLCPGLWGDHPHPVMSWWYFLALPIAIKIFEKSLSLSPTILVILNSSWGLAISTVSCVVI